MRLDAPGYSLELAPGWSVAAPWDEPAIRELHGLCVTEASSGLQFHVRSARCVGDAAALRGFLLDDGRGPPCEVEERDTGAVRVAAGTFADAGGRVREWYVSDGVRGVQAYLLHPAGATAALQACEAMVASLQLSPVASPWERAIADNDFPAAVRHCATRRTPATRRAAVAELERAWPGCVYRVPADALTLARIELVPTRTYHDPELLDGALDVAFIDGRARAREVVEILESASSFPTGSEEWDNYLTVMVGAPAKKLRRLLRGTGRLVKLTQCDPARDGDRQLGNYVGLTRSSTFTRGRSHVALALEGGWLVLTLTATAISRR